MGKYPCDVEQLVGGQDRRRSFPSTPPIDVSHDAALTLNDFATRSQPYTSDMIDASHENPTAYKYIYVCPQPPGDLHLRLHLTL